MKVPPNGFAGLAQQTPAVQALYRGSAMTKRRPGGAGGRRARISRDVARVKRAKKRSAKVARLVKGSAAAKRHMAKLRRMRK